MSEIFRITRVYDGDTVTLTETEVKSENNPGFVFSGFANSARISITNTDKVRCFFQPVTRRESGRVKFYGRALVELTGTPSEVAEKATEISADPFNEQWYNPTTRQASKDYAIAKRGEKPAPKKASKASKKSGKAKTIKTPAKTNLI